MIGRGIIAATLLGACSVSPVDEIPAELPVECLPLAGDSDDVKPGAAPASFAIRLPLPIDPECAAAPFASQIATVLRWRSGDAHFEELAFAVPDRQLASSSTACAVEITAAFTRPPAFPDSGRVRMCGAQLLHVAWATLGASSPTLTAVIVSGRALNVPADPAWLDVPRAPSCAVDGAHVASLDPRFSVGLEVPNRDWLAWQSSTPVDLVLWFEIEAER
jgi:hypothetical protein